MILHLLDISLTFNYFLVYCVHCFLCAGWRVVFPLNSGECLLRVQFGPVACEGFLARATCVFVLVFGAGSHVSGGQCSVQ